MGATRGSLCWRRLGVQADRQQLYDLGDQLPASEVLAAERYLEFLTGRKAPVEPQMLERIDAAQVRPSSGIAHEDVLKEFGL